MSFMKIKEGISLKKQLFSFRITFVKKILKSTQLNLRKHTMCHGIIDMMLGVSFSHILVQQNFECLLCTRHRVPRLWGYTSEPNRQKSLPYWSLHDKHIERL